MSENNINVGGRLHSIATGNVLAGSDEILDDALGKKQSQVNVETYALVENVNNALASLSPEQQGALDVSEKANNNEVKLGYYVCQTEGNVAAKTIAAANYVLSAGGSIKIKMNNANTANNATLNINSTGAKALYYAGERASANNSWEAGETVEVYYDGTSFYANNVAGGSGSGDGAFDISAKTGDTYETLSAALTAANSILSASKKKGGMSIKFIQLTPATYTVVKTEGVETQPTGTEVQEALSLESGTYTAAQMTGVTPPESGSITYYLAVTVDDTTTYTTWVITKDTSDVQKYVQYRYMETDATTAATFTNVANWQGVDDEPTVGSNNLVKSGGVFDKLYIDGEDIKNSPDDSINNLIIAQSGNVDWVSRTGTPTAYIYNVHAGDIIVVKSSSSKSTFALISDYSNIDAGDAVALVPGTNVYRTTSEIIINVPVDCYLCVNRVGTSTSASTAYFPKNIHFKLLASAVNSEKISENANAISQNTTDIESLKNGKMDALTSTFEADMSNMSDLERCGITVTLGVAGEVGAKYSVPVKVIGTYGIVIKFKMPTDLHTSVYSRDFAEFGDAGASNTNGFLASIESALPTTAGAQQRFTSSLKFCPTKNKTNNYAGNYSVGQQNKQFMGDVAFSIRYIGTIEGNTDMAYTIDDSGIKVLHTTDNTIVFSEDFPADNKITSLMTLLEQHSDVIDVEGFNAEGHLCTELIKVENIKLVNTYGTSNPLTDAFPSFLHYIDTDWHTLEVRFDASKGSGLDMITGYIDGARFNHRDNGYSLRGTGEFTSNLTFGCDGMVVKSIKVSQLLRSDIPNIICICLHGINSTTKYDSGITDGDNLTSTYGRIYNIIQTCKENGFAYVTNEDIRNYLEAGKPIPHNAFTIIHDDYFYCRSDSSNANAIAVRKMYMANGIKAAFGMIQSQLQTAEVAECLKDKDVFEFVIHDDYALKSEKGYSTLKAHIDSNIAGFKDKLFTSNIWVYTGGQQDYNIQEMIAAAGISTAYYTSGTTVNGGISAFSNRRCLARQYGNDSAITITQLNNILVNLAKHT